MNHTYTKDENKTGTVIAMCPCCGSIANIWRYAKDKDSPTSKAVMCENNDSIGPRDGLLTEGCLLTMPPEDFYRPTAKDAVKYWNEFAIAITKLRVENCLMMIPCANATR